MEPVVQRRLGLPEGVDDPDVAGRHDGEGVPGDGDAAEDDEEQSDAGCGDDLTGLVVSAVRVATRALADCEDQYADNGQNQAEDEPEHESFFLEIGGR